MAVTRGRQRVLTAAAFLATIAVAGVVVIAQPWRSPWWLYADSDAIYAGAALQLEA